MAAFDAEAEGLAMTNNDVVEVAELSASLADDAAALASDASDDAAALASATDDADAAASKRHW